MFLAGWSDLKTALGSSGMCTGASSELSLSVVCARMFDIDGGGVEGLGEVLPELAVGGTGLVRRPRAVAM